MSEKELMKVVGFYEGLPIDDPKALLMKKKNQIPVPSSRDLLVKGSTQYLLILSIRNFKPRITG